MLKNGLSDARNYEAAVSYRTSKLIQREKVDEQLLILNQYGILVEGGYRNDEIRAANKGKPLNASVSANQTQINHYNFQVENLILQEIVKRKTGQIILEGIRSSGWAVVVRDMWAAGETCNSTTDGGAEMHRGGSMWLSGSLQTYHATWIPRAASTHPEAAERKACSMNWSTRFVW